MKIKSTFAAIAATVALAGTVFLAEPGQATPCIYSQQDGVTDNAPSSNPTVDPTTTEANLGDSNKLGIVGAGFAILGSLFVGGAILRRRFDRKSEPLIEEEVPAEVLLNQLPESFPESLFIPSEFSIEVPPEVLQSNRYSEESESELTSVR